MHFICTAMNQPFQIGWNFDNKAAQSSSILMFAQGMDSKKFEVKPPHNWNTNGCIRYLQAYAAINFCIQLLYSTKYNGNLSPIVDAVTGI
jgi:hypothetical protein